MGSVGSSVRGLTLTLVPENAGVVTGGSTGGSAAANAKEFSSNASTLNASPSNTYAPRHLSPLVPVPSTAASFIDTVLASTWPATVKASWSVLACTVAMPALSGAV